MLKQAAFFNARRAERRNMDKLKEMIKGLKDGQVLKIYFDNDRREEIADGKTKGAGVHTRGAEEGYMADS